MKKLLYSMFLLAISAIIPLSVHAENAQNPIPSWEGTYCNKASDICLRIYNQNNNPHYDSRDYALITVYTDKSSLFITEGEMLITSRNEAEFLITQLTLAPDKKSIRIDEHPYFSSWGDDSINNYGISLLFGKYELVP